MVDSNYVRRFGDRTNIKFITFLLVAVVAGIVLLSQLGVEVIHAAGVVFSAVLTAALVLLYHQQKSILIRQGELMAIRYEPRIRIERMEIGEEEMTFVVTNGGNGPAENLSVRCDLEVSFADERNGSYERMEEVSYETGEASFSLAPVAVGLRRHRGPRAEGPAFRYRDLVEFSQGSHVDTDEEVRVSAPIQVVRNERGGDASGQLLHEVLNELRVAGVTFVTIHLTLVCEDLVGEQYAFYFMGAGKIGINSPYNSLEEVFEFEERREGWNRSRIPEHIEAEATGETEPINSPSGAIIIGPSA